MSNKTVTQRIADAASVLNVAADAANAANDEAELMLRSLKPGVVCYLAEPMAVEEEQRWLGYDRVDGRWCLAIKVSPVSKVPGRPLRQCTRIVRILAAQDGHVAALLEEIAAAVERQCELVVGVAKDAN